MDAITFRSFRFPEDYPAVYALWQQCGPGVSIGKSDTPEEIQKKLQRDPDLFILAEMDGRIIGTVIGGFDGRRGIIYHLAVDPAYRQHGLGRALMDQVEDGLRQKGCRRCYLLVMPGLPHIERFYEGLGWEKMPTSILGKDLIE